ncbi:MAG: Bax inhibitor-1/YccA family protein [bacterium]
MFRSGNPSLKANVFTTAGTFDSSNAMTIQGTVNKTFLLLGLAVLGASLVWNNPFQWQWVIFPAAILALIIAIITIRNKKIANYTAPLYAFIEGILLGVLSSLMEKSFPGIVIQAVSLTFGTLFCLLMLYKSRIIKVTENFKLGVVSATGAILLLYIVDLVFRFFGTGIPFIHESGTMGIIFSLIVVSIAALNLVLDFDFIEKGAEAGAPRYMEWYAAFGLLVTLIWLYLEILRLLAKSKSR